MKAKAIHAAPILLIVVFLCSFVSTLIPADALGADADPYIVTSLLQLFIIAIPAVIFCGLRGGKYIGKLRMKFFSPMHIGFMLFALLFMFFGSCGINYLMFSLFPESNAAVNYEVSGGFAGGLYLVLTMAVIPAITEEFLFRGVIAAEYENYGVPAAVFMSSLTFAMLHFSFARLPVYLFCGFVLAIVLYTTKSVFAAMLVHMLNNTATLFFGNLIYKVVTYQGVVMFCFMLVALILLSAIMMFSECEKIYADYGRKNLDSSYTGTRRRGDGLSGVFYSITGPLFTLLAVIYIIIAAVKL